jgi:hypothetical protein
LNDADDREREQRDPATRAISFVLGGHEPLVQPYGVMSNSPNRINGPDATRSAIANLTGAPPAPAGLDQESR